MNKHSEVMWLRIPADLKERIEKIARAEHRTLASQVVIFLERVPELQPKQPTKVKANQ